MDSESRLSRADAMGYVHFRMKQEMTQIESALLARLRKLELELTIEGLLPANYVKDTHEYFQKSITPEDQTLEK